MSISEESGLLTTPRSGASASASLSVLVVEDDQETAEFLRVFLSDAGYDVLIAADGQQALHHFRSSSPDVVLVDVGLPGIDGFELIELIRASACQLPIILLTAEAQTSSKLRGFDAGADDYMVKPFSGPELLARIGSQIRKQHLINQLQDYRSDLEQEIAELTTSQQTMTTSMEIERSMRLDLLHSVNAHLQSLCAILDTEFRRQPPGAGRDALLRIIPRIHGAALVYQIAEQVTGDTIDFSNLLRTIAASLKHVYSPRKRIPVQVEAGPLTIPSPIASPLAMIATELITNAFKHAFPQGRFGTIDVASSLSGGILSLEVLDDGVGLGPAHIPGRGLASVRQLIDSMSGTFNLISSPAGTRAEVRLPVQEQTTPESLSSAT